MKHEYEEEERGRTKDFLRETEKERLRDREIVDPSNKWCSFTNPSLFPNMQGQVQRAICLKPFIKGKKINYSSMNDT